MISIDYYEQQLRRYDTGAWRRYLNEREGFIARVVTEHAEQDKRVTRREAVQWWREKVERRLAKLNGGQ
jgi:hypothetical protein